MQLTINLPERSEQLAINRQHWAAVLSDGRWAEQVGRIETNAFGQIIMSPPPGGWHSSRQSQILLSLHQLLGGRVLPECPVSTADGVKAVDVAWYSQQRYSQVRGQQVFEQAGEICVEVLSPSNTPAEMEMKRQLYFDAGAIECWQCDLQGNMSYYHHTGTATSPEKTSQLCPDFPAIIKD